MFSVLLTAAIAIGAEPGVAVTSDLGTENSRNEAVEIIVDSSDSNCVDCNCNARSAAMGSGLSCDCIRSSANYPWNWLISLKKICNPPQIGQYDFPAWGKRSCPPYYALYDSPYDYRRVLDYQWQSPSYRHRNVASRCANSTKGYFRQTKPGDEDDKLVPSPEVLQESKTP